MKIKVCLSWVLAAVFAAALTVAGSPAFAQSRAQFDLPSQALADSLRALGSQTSTNVLFDPPLVEGRAAPALKAELTLDQALARILAGTGLKHRFLDDKTVMVISAGHAALKPTADAAASNSTLRLAQVDQETNRSESTRAAAAEKSEDPAVKGIPEILVKGSKILNIDIRRDRDSPQPYVIFDRRVIEQSQSRNIEEFLKNRLPQNTSNISASQQGTTAGNTSSVNLRGLGESQTLILIDGRRAPESYNGQQNALRQPDLNGIPMAAVERIEVLPTTASGIYGGGATGGVINIVLRHDYSGVETNVSYENSFDTDAGITRLGASGGFSFEEGKSHVMFGLSYEKRNSLSNQDQSFTQRYRDRLLENNSNNYQYFNSGTSPPVGYTTNIRSSNGANLVLRNGTALNSPITFVPVGYTGTSSDNGAALAANAGRYNINWGNSEISGGGLVNMTNGATVKSFTATLRREFGERVEAFLDGGASRNQSNQPGSGFSTRGYTLAATAPNNPFLNQSLLVSFAAPAGLELTTDVRNLRATAGVIVKLPGEWLAETDYAWGKSYSDYSVPTLVFSQQPLTAQVGNGSVDVLKDLNLSPLNLSALGANTQPFVASVSPAQYTLKDTTVRLAGPILTMPGGKLSLSAAVERRDAQISTGTGLQSGNPTLMPARSQQVDSAYLELSVPLISASNKMPGIEELTLQLSGRHDRYTTNGVTGQITNPTPSTPIETATNKVQSTDPTIALRYTPVQDVTLRASLGTGFLPPSVQQVVPIPYPGYLQFYALTDPRRGNTPILTGDMIFGGNPGLSPEESESWSAGAILQPRFLPDLRLSIDYTKIRKTDTIQIPRPQLVLDRESQFPGRVSRAQLTPADQALGYTAGVITALDVSSVNLSKANVETYDLQLDYRKNTRSLGAFDFSVLATRQTHYQTQLASGEPVIENVGLSGGPSKLKANAGLTWTHRNLQLGWVSRYYSSHLVYFAGATAATVTNLIRDQGSDHIPSQTYHDIFGTWQFADTGMLAGTELTLGIKNVFNKVPPFDAANSGFGYYSYYGDPRLAVYYVTLKHSFSR